MGYNILGTRQIKKALEEYNKPSYNHGFESAWTFYNAVTESLKSSQLSDKLVKLSNFNQFFVDRYVNPYFDIELDSSN